MRLRHAALTLGITAATLAPTAAHAQSPAAPAPGCGKAADHAFPIKTRIHGGPARYEAGGGAGTWYLDLTNTTRAACRDIHPVVVLTDRKRALATSQVRLELTDPQGHWRPLSLEKSDEDETIGVLDADTEGFAVPARGTVTVRARFVFTGAARPNEIAVSAATVQRRGDDSDWIGESNAYRFKVVKGRDADSEREERPATGDRETGPTDTGGTGETHAATIRPGKHEPSGREPGAHESAGREPAPREPGGHKSSGHEPAPREPGARESSAREPGSRESTGRESNALNPATPSPSATPSHAPGLPELASTGLTGLLGRTAVGAALVLAGVALFVGIRRRRTVRR